MKQTKSLAKLALFTTIAFLTYNGIAQSSPTSPTATQQLQLSAFAGATGTYTDLEGGKNLGITAGADLTFLHFRMLRPSFEIRGTYPIDEGTISSQKNFLLGAKVEHQFGRLHPYADFLIGRGNIDYLNGGYYYNGLFYIQSNSTVYSPGVGVDFNLTDHWAAKADFQFQHWDTPVIPDGALYPKVITFGAVYYFDFNNHRHHH